VPRVIKDAIQGHTEIVVSVLAECEVAKLEGDDDATAERRITDFFNRPYVVRVAVDPLVASETRRLVRERGLKPPDAIYLATAIRHQVPLLETYDGDLLALSDREGSPTVTIRRPHRPPERNLFSLRQS
jgi:predicted nucleic acid-binding protein